LTGGKQLNATRPRRRVKPERGIRLCLKPEGKSPGVVKITVGKETAAYFITLLEADFGRAVRLEKIDPTGAAEKYDVHLDGDKRSCECKGFLRWSHCKHVDGVAALVAAGKL
jgi:hypothetical protein